MAAKINCHRYGTKLRHCHRMYTISCSSCTTYGTPHRNIWTAWKQLTSTSLQQLSPLHFDKKRQVEIIEFELKRTQEPVWSIGDRSTPRPYMETSTRSTTYQMDRCNYAATTTDVPIATLWRQANEAIGRCHSRATLRSEPTIRVSVIYLNFTNLSAHVNCGRGSVLLRWEWNASCTSGSVDDVMFSHYSPLVHVMALLVALAVSTQAAWCIVLCDTWNWSDDISS